MCGVEFVLRFYVFWVSVDSIINSILCIRKKILPTVTKKKSYTLNVSFFIFSGVIISLSDSFEICLVSNKCLNAVSTISGPKCLKTNPAALSLMSYFEQ